MQRTKHIEIFILPVYQIDTAIHNEIVYMFKIMISCYEPYVLKDYKDKTSVITSVLPQKGKRSLNYSFLTCITRVCHISSLPIDCHHFLRPCSQMVSRESWQFSPWYFLFKTEIEPEIVVLDIRCTYHYTLTFL